MIDARYSGKLFYSWWALTFTCVMLGSVTENAVLFSVGVGIIGIGFLTVALAMGLNAVANIAEKKDWAELLVLFFVSILVFAGWGTMVVAFTQSPSFEGSA